MRVLRLALLGLVVSAFAIVAYGSATAPGGAQLVEGHTTFVTFANFTDADGNVSAAAAVAVLVREIQPEPASRFPGVLWFDDQYLVDPRADLAESQVRYPCTGVALATEAGNPDPRGAFDAGAATYVESYHITDPNDRSWDVDKWAIGSPGFAKYFVWVAPIVNNVQSSDRPDDGSSCSAITDQGCPTPESSCAHAPGEVDACLPDACATIRYNAVLFLEMKDLKGSAAPKNHSEGSADRARDRSGCHETDAEWECPYGNDTLEGNSHAYHPGSLVAEPDGATADCDGDARVDVGCHRTVDLDVYYGTAPQPLVKTYVLYDVSGRSEAYGCTFERLPGLC